MTNLEALKAIYAILNQNATFPADLAYAKRIAKEVIDSTVEEVSSGSHEEYQHIKKMWDATLRVK